MNGRYEIAISLSREELEKLLALDSFWAPDRQIEMAVPVTEGEFLDIRPAGNILEHLIFETERADWIRDQVTWDDVRSCIKELVDCYNKEREDGPWELAGELDQFDLKVANKLLRVVAGCLTEEGDFDPREQPTTITEEMDEEYLDPDAVFRKVSLQ